jgi:taurine dioxygenase
MQKLSLATDHFAMHAIAKLTGRRFDHLTRSYAFFANLRMANADLSDEIKAKIDSDEAVHSYARRLATYVGKQPSDEEVRRRWPDVVHPLVHRDPVTGEGALYMDPLSMRAIIGWPDDEARAMLDALLAHATQPKYVYKHSWQPGDLVMWDNGFMLHRRDPVGASNPRLLKRTTVALPAARHIVPSGRLLEGLKRMFQRC